MRKYITFLILFILIICCNNTILATDNSQYIVSNQIGVDESGQEKIIYGFNLENNKISINNALNGEYFKENLEIKIYDIAGNEVVDKNIGLGR